MVQNYKILIVDDDPTSLAIISKILISSSDKYEIFTADSGVDALKIVYFEKPHLIISDWIMPIMSGLELIHQIKSNQDTQYIPVVICSGQKLDINDLKTALDYGAIEYVRKPIIPLELVARVKSILKYTQTLKELAREKEARLEIEKKALEEKLESQNREIIAKALSIVKYNELLKEIYDHLTGILALSDKESQNTKIRSIASNIKSSINNGNWLDFRISFEKTNPYFFETVIKKHPELTKNELKLCALLKLKLNTKQIASITQQSLRSIEMARHRLRRKLKITKDEPLEMYFNLF
jgi:response regulator RpfG family c-di-GMP phosphodiesterase/DNA-binding CsgD family transcriptional regulator